MTRPGPADIAEAVDVIEDVLEWELTEARWNEVSRITAVVRAAMEAADAQTFRAAVVDLELFGPHRFTRLGMTPRVPAPAPLRDQLNELVHSLRADARKGADDDRRPRH